MYLLQQPFMNPFGHPRWKSMRSQFTALCLPCPWPHLFCVPTNNSWQDGRRGLQAHFLGLGRAGENFSRQNPNLGVPCLRPFKLCCNGQVHAVPYRVSQERFCYYCQRVTKNLVIGRQTSSRVLNHSSHAHFVCRYIFRTPGALQRQPWWNRT